MKIEAEEIVLKMDEQFQNDLKNREEEFSSHNHETEK